MKQTLAFFFVLLSVIGYSQVIKIDFSEIENKSVWKIHNREITTVSDELGKIETVGFNAKPNDGLAYFQNLEFENGTIEFDVKGKNMPGKSFVGIAFHVQDEETYNAVYFRPFNFKNPDPARSGHSVQYISHPEFTWRKLRTEFPEQFENPVKPVPKPNEWFHAKVVVNWPNVNVYVENNEEPSLSVKMKSTFKKGKIGFWAGFGSDGWYKNLVVTKQ